MTIDRDNNDSLIFKKYIPGNIDNNSFNNNSSLINNNNFDVK